MSYSFNLIWSEEDKAYVATVPEFSNLSALGATPEEALKEAKIALEAYIESAGESDIPLPQPQEISDYSGQLRIRMPRVLHQSLAVAADRNGTSLNTYMVFLLSANHAYTQQHEKIKNIYRLMAEESIDDSMISLGAIHLANRSLGGNTDCWNSSYLHNKGILR